MLLTLFLVVLILLALLALNIALWRSILAPDWWPGVPVEQPASSER